MSLKLNERYPGRFTNPSVDYPLGSFKNRTTPTAKDGSYLEKDWANDKEGFFQSLLSSARITSNGLVDKVGASQFFDAFLKLKQDQAGIAFSTTGASAALLLTPIPAITAYSANQRFRVKFGFASTGSDTLNVSGLGAKSIKQYSGTGSKVPAIFYSSQLVDIEYDGTDFVILNPLLPSKATESIVGVAAIATQTATNAGTDDTVIVTPKKLRWGFSISLNANGYVAFPSWLGSFVVQWGQGTSSGTAAENVSISMPLAWPTGSFVEVATVVGSNTGNYTVTRGTLTLSTMKFTALLNGSFASGISIRWIAIGY